MFVSDFYLYYRHFFLPSGIRLAARWPEDMIADCHPPEHVLAPGGKRFLMGVFCGRRLKSLWSMTVAQTKIFPPGFIECFVKWLNPIFISNPQPVDESGGCPFAHQS